MRISIPQQLILTATLAVALLVATPAHSNLLLNPSFEAVDASASPFFIRSNANTPGWTQFGDGVDLIHNSYTQGPAVLVDASDGVQFLDMNQAGALGGIQQVAAAVSGVTYRLDLDSTAWATNSRGGTIEYSLYNPDTNTTLALATFSDSVGGTWNTLSLSANATSSQIGVRIRQTAVNQAGLGVDNVRLNAVTVPEPTALVMISTGLLLGLPLVRRRARVLNIGRN